MNGVWITFYSVQNACIKKHPEMNQKMEKRKRNKDTRLLFLSGSAALFL